MPGPKDSCSSQARADDPKKKGWEELVERREGGGRVKSVKLDGEEERGKESPSCICLHCPQRWGAKRDVGSWKENGAQKRASHVRGDPDWGREREDSCKFPHLLRFTRPATHSSFEARGQMP